jgi:heat shock protein HslJ
MGGMALSRLSPLQWGSAGRAAICGLALVLSLAPAAAQMGPKLPRRQQEEKPKGPTGPAEQQFPYGATWILSEIGGRPVSGDAPSFDLDDKLRATGFGGCNTFSMALYPIREQKLAAGSIAMTKKTCGKDLDETEKSMLVTLHSLPKWHLESNGDLTVTGPNGAVLKFKRGL